MSTNENVESKTEQQVLKSHLSPELDKKYVTIMETLEGLSIAQIKCILGQIKREIEDNAVWRNPA